MVKELFTKAGQQAIAKAIADKTTLKITRIAVGDGGGATYTPTEEQTALKGQKWSGELNRIVVNPENEKQLICEGLIAPGVGGFYIREVGLFDENNVLIAVSDFPESFKAAADQYELYVRMILEVSNTDVTNIIVKKDMVYATKEYVDNVVNSSGIAEELAAHKAEYAKLLTDIDTLKKLRKERSNKDSNGVFTTVTYKRKSDGTIYAKSVLSGGTAPQYTTRTETFYDVDGTTVLATIPYTLSYDADGDWVGEV